MRKKNLFIGVAAIVAASSIGASASAALLTFDGHSPGDDGFTDSGFVFDTTRIVNGNCLAAPCLALNGNETTTITHESGLLFTLKSFWFQLLGNGNPNNLTVTADGVAFTFAEAMFPHNNGGQFADLSGNPAFKNISSLSFSTSGGGNVRIDDLDLTPIPLPAALPLMAMGLGAGGFLARLRRKRVAA